MSESFDKLASASHLFLYQASAKFDAGVADLNTQLTAALEALAKNPSDPKLLSEYQSLFSDYTLYRNAQSGAVKAYKDVSSAIISNFR
ncbi:type III secretion system needle complex protein [Pantoea endophytica]|uniref:Type III secretion system needle complex protein n=1 Tax=Pantoea sp. BJ2 TaxID=3141322 RepID=A0AAU7U4K1_9GAMM